MKNLTRNDKTTEQESKGAYYFVKELHSRKTSPSEICNQAMDKFDLSQDEANELISLVTMIDYY